MLLQLHNILRDKTEIKHRFEELLNQVAALENEKATLNTEILGLRNSIYTNNEIIRKKNLRLRTLDRKLRQLEVMLQNANKEPNYHKVTEIVGRRLNDKRSLLLAALIAVLNTLKANPYGLNLLDSSSLDIEDYVADDIDGKNLLQFAESCYNILLRNCAKTIARD
jgi:cell division septum initiation protein DivIVA